MPTHAAFLRGINLGGRRLTNDQLRVAFERFGLDGVDTYLASGNVVFSHPGGDLGALEVELEAHLEEALGFVTDTFIRPLEELAPLTGLEILEGVKDEGFKPHVIFLKGEAGADVEEALGSLESPDDRFHVLGREVVWLRRGGISDSVIEPRHLDRAFQGATHTMRTLNTVRRLVEKFAD